MSSTSDPTRQDPTPGAGYDPPRMKLILAAVATMVLAAGLFALFGGSSGEPDRPASAEGLPFVDGTLKVVEQNALEMTAFQPVDGETELTFVIAPEDQPNFDIAHLQSHSSVAIPTRIFYREENGTRYAVYKQDAPVNSQAP